MIRHPAAQTDPLLPSAGIAAVFAALVLWHLGIPSVPYFDEIHYVPASRQLLALLPANPEHPLVGKELIAAAIALLGDHPWAWRLPSALLGVMGLFAFGRALWFASGRSFAALAGMVLLGSDFAWVIESRIAMLDMAMAGLGMVALWQIAAAVRLAEPTNPRPTRVRLAVAGVAMGLAIGAKWSLALPLAALCLALVVVRVHAGGKRWLEVANAPPLPGIPLIEMLFWLGSLTLLTYWFSFLPAFFYHRGAINPFAMVTWHRHMLTLQASVIKHHPYQSVWYQWVINWRPIWYLYEKVDGAQRGVIMLGNPLTMLAGLPALLWCGWRAWRGRPAEGAALLLYVVSIGQWALNGKPVQFYYHYLIPGSMLMAALALALDSLWAQRRWWRLGAPVVLTGALGMFAWFLPIITSGALDGPGSFATWMWLPSWR